MTQLIALHGPAGSGKSYCGDIFRQFGFIRVKFADPLKNMLRAYLTTVGVPEGELERYVEGDLKERPCHYLSGNTPRWAMQSLGTEWGRMLLDPNLWANAAIITAMGHIREGRSVVIDDCRFPNEAEAVRDHGGKVVEIIGRRHTVPTGSHQSETPLDQKYIDFALNNTGSRGLATSEVRRIMQAISEGTNT